MASTTSSWLKNVLRILGRVSRKMAAMLPRVPGKYFNVTKNICLLLVTGDAERELHHAIEQPVGEDEVVELRLARHLGADQAGVVIAAIVGVPGHHCLDIRIQIS